MRDVSRRLKISLEDTISKDVREALRCALVAAKQPTTEAAAKAAMERVRAARVRAQVAQRMAADMQALQRDALLAQKAGLPTGKLARQVLSHLSGHPFHPADVKDDVPLVQPIATGLPSGPYVSSAQYNYWLGDHYHDEAGPPGVLVDSGDIIDKKYYHPGHDRGSAIGRARRRGSRSCVPVCVPVCVAPSWSGRDHGHVLACAFGFGRG